MTTPHAFKAPAARHRRDPRHRPAGRPLAPALHLLREERGVALLTALLVMVLILFLGTFAIVNSRSEIRTSANYGSRLQAQYFAESGIEQLIGYQNDVSKTTRYLFDPASYVSMSADSSVLTDVDAIDAKSGKKVGTIHRVILADPLNDAPPYAVVSTAIMADGSQATYQVDIYTKSLLDFAFYSEGSLSSCPPNTFLGRVYTAGSFSISGSAPCSGVSTFAKRVEYVSSISGTSYGDFREGYYQVPAYPALASLVNLTYYENAAKTAGVCKPGVGLYITATKGSSQLDSQSQDFFWMQDKTKPGIDDLTSSSQWSNDGVLGLAVTGCADVKAGECYQIDLTLFDFKADPITYGGKTLIGWDGSKLRPSNFNGVIYVDGELHVWGILGGRSAEDRVTRDSVTTYDATRRRPTADPTLSANPPTEAVGTSPRGKPFHHHPRFAKLGPPWTTLIGNLYSNNQLDPGEDTNGNGILDPAGLGRSLTIVTAKGADIIIDHNIYYGTDPSGKRPSLSLISGNAVLIDANSPRAQLATGSKLGLGTILGSASFLAMPNSDETTHRLNFWAKAAGDLSKADSTYAYDLNGDGTVEADNGMGKPGDGTETAMRASWNAYDLGNIVTAGGAGYGVWSAGAHARTYVYDSDLLVSEPPCQPVQSYYGTVAGTFSEVRR